MSEDCYKEVYAADPASPPALLLLLLLLFLRKESLGVFSVLLFHFLHFPFFFSSRRESMTSGRFLSRSATLVGRG